MNYLKMTGYIVRTASDNWTLGYEGENNARTLRVKTTDSLTNFATVNLLIDTLDCGAMTIQTVSNYRVLEMVITEEMLGLPGLKTCQLVMKNTAGSVVLKTNQFYMYVKSSNVTDRIYISTEDTIKAALTALINDGVLEDLSIEDGSITTAKIANGAITQAKLDPNISFEADDELDATSTNAVQNKVVAQAIGEVNESLGDVVDNMELLVEDVVETTYPESETHSGYQIDASGNIISSGSTGDINAAYMVTDLTNVAFKVWRRVSGADRYAFYSAESYENCGASTMVGSAISYANGVDNVVAVPEGANMILVTYKIKEYFRGQIVTTQSKAELSVDAMSQKLDDALGDSMTFKTYSDFVIGRKGLNTDIVTSGVITGIISHPFIMDRTIHLEVKDGYQFTIYYFSKEWTDAGSTGGINNANYRTILAGSRIMIVIQKLPSVEVSVQDIPEYIEALTFKTNYKDLSDNADGGDINSLSALMYQKGAAPKAFSNTGIGILCAGQSQMDGRVPFEDLPSDITLPMDNAYSVNGSTGATSKLTFSGKWGVEVSLFDALSKADINAYRIKYAVGDTGLYYSDSNNYNWSPFYEKTIAAGKVSLLRSLEDYARKAMDVDGNIFDVRAFVWMQGERDRRRNNRVYTASYYTNLKCLIAYIRGVVGNKNLPFICGTVSRESNEYDRVVEEATIKACEEDDNAVCIRMTRAPLLTDNVHLNADSAVYFGRKAFDALIDMGVISATKLNPTKPWTDYLITESYTNCSSDNVLTEADHGTSLTITITASSGYELESVTVFLGETDVTESVYDNDVVTITSLTDDLTIIASAS